MAAAFEKLSIAEGRARGDFIVAAAFEKLSIAESAEGKGERRGKINTFTTVPFGLEADAVKDVRGSIPSFNEITHGRVHDVNILDQLVPEPDSVYVMDRGYFDFRRLYALTQCLAIFVIRAKRNLQFERLCSCPVDGMSGLFAIRRSASPG